MAPGDGSMAEQAVVATLRRGRAARRGRPARHGRARPVGGGRAPGADLARRAGGGGDRAGARRRRGGRPGGDPARPTARRRARRGGRSLGHRPAARLGCGGRRRGGRSTPTTLGTLADRYREAAGGERRPRARPACTASRRPPPRVRCVPAGGWSTSAARPTSTRRSTPRPCGAGRCACSATPTTSSAPTGGPRPSGAVASYAAEGKLSVAREVLPLESVGEAWLRQAEGRTTGRIVLTTG